ncbi:hypothetical protein VN97_g3438 [Penicillium thymicola]|uniref:Uncharacterized protein n=1 Tax=Penicillium thymicola TaxID=293382 RepID=A0AAI9XAS9_PENTH|nr:hypothetical protein VN97_g3438 [Penicillium thymicola]
MHFFQSHKAPQNKTASDRQKLKFTNPILTIFGEPSQGLRVCCSSPTGYRGSVDRINIEAQYMRNGSNAANDINNRESRVEILKILKL